MKVLILTNGDYGDYSFCQVDEKYDYIICADNGIQHAKRLGILPNRILGDFDSCSQEDLEYFKQAGVMIQQVSSVKDETDTELAVDTAISLGATEIMLYGGLGSRIDHTLGNIHLLKKTLELGIQMWILNHKNEVTLIKDKITLRGHVGEIVSLLPLSMEVTGIYTAGLAYAVTNGCFVLGSPIGVSNVFSEETARVQIATGLLLVMKSRD